jgi:hypothetical protein
MIDIRPLRELDYGIAVSVQALITAMGMFSENLQRIQRNEAIAYPDKAFEDLIDKTGTHHNGVLRRWEGV